MPIKETRGRPQKHPLVVAEPQRQELEQMVKQRRHRALVFRARIILKCGAGQKDSDVAASLRTTSATAGYWRHRFSQGRVDSLWDEPRPGAEAINIL
jgi:hypothetical protein